jgi:hypothetical protein
MRLSQKVCLLPKEVFNEVFPNGVEGTPGMLTIREEQMEMFRSATGGVFEDHLVEHLQLFAPDKFAELGEEGLRQVIRYGMKRADNFGFTMRGPSRFYVETMFILGSDFDTDPQYPWAFDVLADQGIMDEVKRADALHGKLMEYISAAGSPEMIRHSMVATREWFDETPPAWDDNFKRAMLEVARTAHPEKFNYVGEAQLRVLIEDSERRADFFGMATGAGISLQFVLAYVLGHGCAFDPQFPWISDSLTDIEPTKRYGLLLENSEAYWDRAITNLEKET